MIRTASGRVSRTVKWQLWLIGAQAVTLFGWVGSVVTPTWAPIVHGLLGSVQAISAILLRQTTSEPMATRRRSPGLVSLVLGALSGCATLEFTCNSDGRIDVFDGKTVNTCLDGSAPTITWRARRIYGCGIEPKPVVGPVVP